LDRVRDRGFDVVEIGLGDGHGEWYLARRYLRLEYSRTRYRLESKI
jgi:hypothetical protein